MTPPGRRSLRAEFFSTLLDLAVDDVRDQRAHELQVRSLLRVGEGRSHPLLGGIGQRLGDLPVRSNPPLS